MTNCHDKEEECTDMSKKIECRLPDDLWKDLKEYAGKEGVTVTDIVIAGIQDQLYSRNTTEKPLTKDMPALPKSPVASNSEVKKPVKTPYKAPEAGKPLANGYIPKSASHHPCCLCGVCKPLSDKLSRL